MRLLEAIIDANHRALAGDAAAGLHLADFADELPVVALTCIDTRLNRLLPQVLGVPEEQFIWLRNAGNILTGPLSSTMRSLALACAIKGGQAITIIGHTDCAVGKMGTMELIDRFRALGIGRDRLPENVNDYFGTFASERANVLKAVDIARASPLISPRIAVHGLLVDTGTGSLEWLVNGYQTLANAVPTSREPVKPVGLEAGSLGALGVGGLNELKFPETRIGEIVSRGDDWLAEKAASAEPKTADHPPQLAQPPQPPRPPQPPPAVPPKIPLPPPIKPRVQFRRDPRRP